MGFPIEQVSFSPSRSCNDQVLAVSNFSLVRSYLRWPDSSLSHYLEGCSSFIRMPKNRQPVYTHHHELSHLLSQSEKSNLTTPILLAGDNEDNPWQRYLQVWSWQDCSATLPSVLPILLRKHLFQFSEALFPWEIQPTSMKLLITCWSRLGIDVCQEEGYLSSISAFS